MNRLTRPAFAMLFLWLASEGVAFAAEVHKSTDDSGTPVFSDQAPTDRPSEKISIDVPPPQDRAGVQRRVDETVEAQNQRAAERNSAARDRAASEQAARQQRDACANARSRLKTLTNQPPNRRLVIEPDGSSRRVSWDEMQALIRAAEVQVAKDCEGVTNVPATTSTRQPSTPVRSTSSADQRTTGSASQRNASGSGQSSTPTRSTSSASERTTGAASERTTSSASERNRTP